MRKLVVTTMLTLDGVFMGTCEPAGEVVTRSFYRLEWKGEP